MGSDTVIIRINLHHSRYYFRTQGLKGSKRSLCNLTRIVCMVEGSRELIEAAGISMSAAAIPPRRSDTSGSHPPCHRGGRERRSAGGRKGGVLAQAMAAFSVRSSEPMLREGTFVQRPVGGLVRA